MNGVNNTGEPIRVLNVFASLDRGGSLSMCMNYYRHLNRSKVQFDFVTHSVPLSDVKDEIISLGGRVFVAPRYCAYNHASYLKWWSRHLQAHPEHTIIHGHYYTIAFAYAPVAKHYGRCRIVHSHNVRAGKAEGLGKRIELGIVRRLTARNSDVRFACSDAAGRWLFPRADYRVVHNAIEIDRFRYDSDVRKRVRKNLAIDDRCKLMLVVGNLSRQKNPSGVVSICQALVRRSNRWRLIWCGGGSLNQELEQTLKSEGLLDYCSLTGVRSDIDRLLQAADVFVMPSLHEGLSVAAVEAQAAGLPCLLADTLDRAHDIVGLCTFLPLGEWDMWADAILSDCTLREDTAAKIRAAGYDVALEASILERTYVEIAGEYCRF